MNARALERLFLRFLMVAPIAAPPLAMMACTMPGSTTSLSCSGDRPVGHTDVTLAAIREAMIVDAGATADASASSDANDDAATDDGSIADAAHDAGAIAPADGGSVSLDAGASLPFDACFKLCPASGVTSSFCSIESIHGDTATIKCLTECTGRRPAGLLGDAAAGTFAEMARLEAASVHAFKRLRAELARHGAPRALLRACSRAARDEVRHARVAGALARRRGEHVPQPRVAPFRARSLEALAIENAVEGCVRETWGALEATRHAQAHTDLDVRAAMKRIARDETKHAALAWSIAAWLEPRLNGDARERVRAARDAEARVIAARAVAGSNAGPSTRAAQALASELWGVAA